jgi:plasmid stabilization system protein ParE
MIKGARTYHLEFSRSRVSGSTVKEPRHFLLYRRREDGVIEVARILHDGRDLQRHLPEEYRRGTAPL